MQRTSTLWGLIKIKWFRGLERVESEWRELKSEGELDDENSEAHPPPFYTRLCLCIETGTRPAAGLPLWCYGHRHCIVLPTGCGWRDGHQRSEAPITISRNIACRTSFSSVFVLYGPHFSPSDDLRATTRLLGFGMPERIFYYRIPFSSSPSRSRSPQLTSNSCIGRCIRSKNLLPAHSLTTHLITRWKTSAWGGTAVFVQAR